MKEQPKPQLEFVDTGVESEDFPSEFAADVFQHTPLLHYYSNSSSLVEQQPFAGKRVYCVLHFLRDLLPFVESMERLGLAPKNSTFFYKSYPYPQQKQVQSWLISRGYHVLPCSGIGDTLDQLFRSKEEAIGDLLIIEDGGFFVPAIHRNYTSLIPHVIGAVEQTMRGIMNCGDWLDEDANNELGFPVLSVATSKLKSDFEPRYIGQAVLKNIESLTGLSLTGKKLAVLGYGTIGSRIVSDARSRGVDVKVYAPDYGHRLSAQQAGVSCASTAAEAIGDAQFVIGSSGKRSIGSTEIASMRHGAYIASASSEDYEIDREELRQQSRREEPLLNANGNTIGTRYILRPSDRQLNLLANGYPINFWGMNSMPDEAADMILSLILLGAVELSLGEFVSHQINDAAINEIATKYEITKKFLEFWSGT